MKKTKQIIKIIIISIVIIGLVATYLLAGLAPTPRRETAPVEEYVDYEQLSSELEESQQAESIENIDSNETNFTGPPAGSIPRTSGPTSLPL